MSNSKLPERASLEYLKKLAKDRLQELRRADPRAKLATALLAVAQDHGFSSWRALKAELDRRQTKNVALFFEACAKGDVEALRGLLANDPSLARVSNPRRTTRAGPDCTPPPSAGTWTPCGCCSSTARIRTRARPETTPTRCTGLPRSGHLETVRALLDAGGDVHGFGDVHELDVIGWATFYRAPGDDPKQMDASRRDVVSLLLERGARHHIFSAIVASATWI